MPSASKYSQVQNFPLEREARLKHTLAKSSAENTEEWVNQQRSILETSKQETSGCQPSELYQFPANQKKYRNVKFLTQSLGIGNSSPSLKGNTPQREVN